jgi:alpha-glucosidase
VTRIGTPAARLAAVLLLTLRGTPTLYYGDELGMEDVTIEPAAVRDRFEKNVPGLGLGRDPARTPMCWTGGPNGSFTTGTPWLPVGDNVKRPVKHQAKDASTMLSLYRRLIALRRAEPALSVGSYESLSLDPECLAYGRSYGDERFVILLNFSDAMREVVIPEGSGPARILLSSAADRASHVVDGMLSLAAAEAVVLRLDRK